MNLNPTVSNIVRSPEEIRTGGQSQLMFAQREIVYYCLQMHSSLAQL